jgi:hypothetical protein
VQAEILVELDSKRTPSGEVDAALAEKLVNGRLTII